MRLSTNWTLGELLLMISAIAMMCNIPIIAYCRDLKAKYWEIIYVILLCIMLIFFPIGTVLGIYEWWNSI